MPEVVDRLNAALTGRYRIDRELGQGGMATVYLAEDLRHERNVALKVMRSDVVELIGAERFLQEIRVTANLQHPHILPLFDSGEADGMLFYVMPYVEGESLRDRLEREGALPVSDARRILREIVDALGAAHERGIVHRDVKPANVLLAGRHAQVADFGVAKAVREASSSEQLTTIGVAIGTPRYMSPEQAAADPDTDHRADLFAAGVIAYEMLTGDSPFAGETPQSTLASLLTEDPDPVTEHRPEVPGELAAVVHRCLEKEPDARWQSAAELVSALEGMTTPTAGTPTAGTPAATAPAKSGGRYVPALGLVAVAAIAFLLFGLPGEDLEAWARTEALPEIESLTENGQFEAAHRLALRAAEAIPGDSTLEELRTTITTNISVETDPPGAVVSRRAYDASAGEWEVVGTTPLADARVPRGATRVRIELEGHQTVEVLRTGGGGSLTIPLRPLGASTDEMVFVGRFQALIDGGRVALADFWLDRFEVTNREYKEFVDAGGYERPEFWREPFVEDGRTLPWEVAMSRFRDPTGQPGPATWQVGSFRDGEDDYPVSGVSWYEAAAYAAFVGKSLPTVHHWNRAFNPGHQAYVIPQSNLEEGGVAEVGTYRGVSWVGAFDMAGNVREWCLNESDDDRYIMGGGWNDPDWAAYGGFAQSPFDRTETNGIRLATYTDEQGLSVAEMPIAPVELPDYSAFEPVTDEVFEIYESMFAYDSGPLHEEVEAVDTTRHWIRERVTFDAAYGDERMMLHLFLPRDREPPYQSVVFWPGSNALTTRSVDGYNTAAFDFILRSGRAVAFPVYKGTLERETDLAQRAADLGLRYSSTPRRTSVYREHVIRWVLDGRRTIDYLEARPEIDAETLAFYGSSWGGRMGPILLALDPRFEVGILRVAGFSDGLPQPEVRTVTYAPRVDVPILMLNGQYDHIFPLATQARPLFEALGTAPEHKRQFVSDGGHFVPRNDLIRESLAWLDRYLGPVR